MGNLDFYTIKNVLTRFFGVGAIAVVFSIVAFGLRVFDMHSIYFMIMANGVVIAAAYATLKSDVFQNEQVAALLVMIFVLVILSLPLGGWELVSVTSYMVGLTAAVTLYCSIVAKHEPTGRAWRISMALLILGLADILVFFFLRVASLRMFPNPVGLLHIALSELWEGVIMTAVSSVAIEVAEWLVKFTRAGRAVVD